MGALFGFTGRPDAALLARMGETLVHRGRAPTEVAELPAASFAVRPRFAPAERGISLSGVHRDGTRALAIAGYLLGLADEQRTPAALLGRYAERGLSFLDELRGAFVLALIDGETVHLVRDGAGVRTLYYGQHQGRLWFAVEPKGVLAAPGFPRRIRPAAVAQYLSFSFVPGASTMLEGLFELEAGQRLTFERGEQRLARWFTFEDHEPDEHEPLTASSEQEWTARFKDEHARAVAERRPAGKVGVFLSGGLDSSIVTAELAQQHRAPVLSYSLHFGAEYPHELDFSRAVAERCRTTHSEVLLRPKDFLPRLRRIVWHLDDPIGDPITVPNFELSSRVARDVSWIFNGEGGDPCFGGPKNLPMMLHHWYGGIERGPGFRERMYLGSYRRSYEEWPRLLAPAWASQVDAQRDLESLLTPFFDAERPRAFLNKLCATNLRLKGAHLILPKVDRMAAAHGLVPLSPLFDERLIRLSFAMPPRLKLNHGVEKVVLKNAYRDALPASVIDRPKSGMRVPVHHWLQGEMKSYAKKILAPRELKRAGLFEPKRVKQLLDYDIEEGPGRYGLRLWMLITLEIWRRIVVEGEAV